MQNKYAHITFLSQELKQAEISLCWEMRGWKGDPRRAAKRRREIVRELASVK